jgi:hypothetical protein
MFLVSLFILFICLYLVFWIALFVLREHCTCTACYSLYTVGNYSTQGRKTTILQVDIEVIRRLQVPVQRTIRRPTFGCPCIPSIPKMLLGVKLLLCVRTRSSTWPADFAPTGLEEFRGRPTTTTETPNPLAVRVKLSKPTKLVRGIWLRKYISIWSRMPSQNMSGRSWYETTKMPKTHDRGM